MKLSPRERAMLREMGVAWPEVLEAPVPAVEAQAEASPIPIRSPSPVVKAAPAAVMAPVVSAVAATQGEPWPQQANWEELQAAVSTCQRCGLCGQRRHTVFGVGHPHAAWMVVGEAPGEQEDRQGEPFVGAAGQLLDRMLASMGLSRGPSSGDGAVGGVPASGPSHGEASAQQVFITNTVKCRPPQNRNPEASELAACAPVLQRQMELVRPRLVLAMGRFAAQQLLRTEEPIGRLRGRVHQLPAVDGEAGLPVVVTYHPAYLLRNPIDKAKVWDDLCLAMDTMERLLDAR